MFVIETIVSIILILAGLGIVAYGANTYYWQRKKRITRQ
jgi:hypothetical protein